MKKLTLTLMTLGLLFGSFNQVRAAEDARVKSTLQEALKLYGDHQYVRALDLFKQVQALDPTNPTAEEYIKNTKQRILEWELQGNEKETPKQSANWDTLAPTGTPDMATNSKDIIAARKSLVDRMKNRSTNTDNIVQIDQTSRGLEVTLFHDQLFVPGLQTLRDEALPVLQNVSDMIRTGGDKEVTIRCATHNVDDDKETYDLYPEFALPAPEPGAGKKDAAAAFQDLDSTRALILFTHLAQRSMAPTPDAVIE
jgi:flagellar motor protein MotB